MRRNSEIGYRIAVAFDAMTQDRPYRQAMTTGEALRKIAACKGVMFDPILADKLIGLFTAKQHT